MRKRGGAPISRLLPTLASQYEQSIRIRWAVVIQHGSCSLLNYEPSTDASSSKRGPHAHLLPVMGKNGFVGRLDVCCHTLGLKEFEWPSFCLLASAWKFLWSAKDVNFPNHDDELCMKKAGFWLFYDHHWLWWCVFLSLSDSNYFQFYHKVKQEWLAPKQMTEKPLFS